MTRRLVVEADGGSRGNPGVAGYGALVADADTGEVLAERFESLGTTTNNVAEYSGLVAGLRAAGELAPGADVQVRMDSKLVVEQMSGRWQIKDPNLRKLAAQARQACGGLGSVSYTWIPRARNARADRLANQAMDAASGTARSAPAGRRETSHRSGSTTAATDDAGPAAGTAPRHGWGPAAGTATTTLLLRHGQTPLSTERRFAGRADIPLTETGLEQAAAAAKYLAGRGDIDLIVASPLRRARRTAEAVAATTGAPVIAEPDLVEADFGAWEGLSFAEAREQYPDELAAWLADPDAAPPGGESVAALGLRVTAALDRLLAQHRERTLLIVSHVTPIKTLVCRALLAPPAALFRIHLDVASLCEVDWFPGGQDIVRSVNDTSYLR